MTDRWQTYWDDVRVTHATLLALDIERAHRNGFEDGRAEAVREIARLTAENVALTAEVQRLRGRTGGGNGQ